MVLVLTLAHTSPFLKTTWPLQAYRTFIRLLLEPACRDFLLLSHTRCLTKQPGSQLVLHCPQRCWMGLRSGVCAVMLSCFTANHFFMELALCLGALSRNKKETNRWHKVVDLTTWWIRNKSNNTKYLQKSNYFVVWIELSCCQLKYTWLWKYRNNIFHKYIIFSCYH